MNEQERLASENCDVFILNLLRFQRRLKTGQVGRGEMFDAEDVQMLMMIQTALQHMTGWILNLRVELDVLVIDETTPPSNEDDFPF